MDPKKQRRLEAKGWRVGTVQEFLDLSDAETELIDMHVRLVDEIKRRLGALGMSQAALAEQLETSTSRLSNMLAGRQVSADALVRALLVIGATTTEVGRVVAGGSARKRSKKRSKKRAA